MAAQKGKDLLIKIADGAGGFVTVAGLRTRQLAFNAEAVDVTNAESAGRWRELLGAAGVRRAAVTGAGVFRDEASDARLRQVFFDGAIESYRIPRRPRRRGHLRDGLRERRRADVHGALTGAVILGSSPTAPPEDHVEGFRPVNSVGRSASPRGTAARR